jgi:iron complex outermembrane recepter protein
MSIYRATLRGAVLSGVAIGALSVANSAAWAQQTPAAPAAPDAVAAPQEQEAGSGDIIIVTGSRLRQESFDSPNPVLTVGIADIENKQVNNAVDVIEDIPLIGIGTNNRGTQVQNGDSFAFPDILDLGTQRTLTLLNGRRVVGTNPGSVFVPGNASGSQVDLSVFTPSMIERVEVLAGTGGAIYGADAVAGVVNLITKNDFEGLTLNLSGGMTEIGDGEQIKFGATYGTDLFDGRGHIMVTGDYFHQELIGASTDSNARYGGTGINNAFEGARRNSFSAASAADTLRGGGTLAPVFQAQASDRVQSIYFGPLSLQNPLITQGGTLLTHWTFQNGAANTTNLVPATPINTVLARPDANGITFFAPTALSAGANATAIINTLAPGTNLTGLSGAQLNTLALAVLQANRPTPYEYYQANPNLNPYLFAGTFGPSTNPATGLAVTNLNYGGYTVVPNTDPATSGIFPRVAQPYMFAANGNLVPLNIGNLLPQGRLGQTFGGAGYDAAALGHNQFQAGTDRVALASVADYDFSDNLRWNSQWMYTYSKFEQTGGAVTHSPGGSQQAGTIGVPIYVDQNPYVSSQARTTIDQLQAAGQTIGTVAGQGGARVMYMGRALDDLLGGGVQSELEVQNFQITNVLEGEFDVLGREFYWDVAQGYGRSDQKSTRPDFLDIEFALAVDVVQTPNGPRCRQQTLAAPESVLIRNPGLAATITTLGFTPTAAQVAACQPLNLFGAGNASSAARDYVIGSADVHALNTLEYYSASVGSNILDVPAGSLSVGGNIEYRKEGFEFEPSRDTQLGLGRTAPQARGEGTSTFTEYGFEALLPVFGGDFTFPGLHKLDFSYAQRIVKRETESPTVTVPVSETEDDTFNYSVSYSPISDLSFRAAKSRTVRSPSLVELVGPFTIAFSGLTAATNPCISSQIGLGPNPTARTANCITAAMRLNVNGGADNVTDAGEAAAFLSTFAGSAGTRPANAAGNPGLVNEEADTYTLGFTYEPDFIPNLVIASDFFAVDLENEIGLFGPANFTGGCFDASPTSPTNPFPDSQFGGALACDTFLFGVLGADGLYRIPANNAITNRPGAGGVLAGSLAPIQAQMELAFVGFANLNAATREFRGVNTEIRYNFDLVDLPYIGGSLADAGEMFLRLSHFHTQRYDTNAGSLDRLVGEHGNPEHEVRFDIRHRVGPFDHTLQAFWNSRTVTTIETAKGLYAEQNASFVAPEFMFYNYSASYEINDRFTIRGTINNLFDTTDPRGAFGVGNQYDAGIGREFIVGVTARF